jgi:hypothetical protein
VDASVFATSCRNRSATVNARATGLRFRAFFPGSFAAGAGAANASTYERIVLPFLIMRLISTGPFSLLH